MAGAGKQLHGLKRNSHGYKYQANLLALYMLRSWLRKSRFCMETEKPGFGFFDDLVLKDENTYVQIKHKLSNKKKITAADLSKEKSEYNLGTLFTSYTKILETMECKPKDIMVIFFTNAEFDDDIINDHETIIRPLEKRDRIFDFELHHGEPSHDKQPQQYQFLRFSKEINDVIEKTTEVKQGQVKDFRESLIFAVNQPNEKQLGEILDREIATYFGKAQGKEILERLTTYIWNWMFDESSADITKEIADNMFTEWWNKAHVLTSYLPEPPEQQYRLKKNSHGYLYQSYLLALYMLQSWLKKSPFSMKTKKSEVGLFGDLVLNHASTFVQIKNTLSEKIIEAADFINKKSEYNLGNLFKSYKQILETMKCESANIKVIFFTNADFDKDGINLKATIKELKHDNSLFGFYHHHDKPPQQYHFLKFSKEVISDIKNATKASEKEILEFRKSLVFAVNQPNVKHIAEILKQEIAGRFSNPEGEDMFERLTGYILKWMLNESSEEITKEKADEMFFKWRNKASTSNIHELQEQSDHEMESFTEDVVTTDNVDYEMESSTQDIVAADDVVQQELILASSDAKQINGVGMPDPVAAPETVVQLHKGLRIIKMRGTPKTNLFHQQANKPEHDSRGKHKTGDAEKKSDDAAEDAGFHLRKKPRGSPTGPNSENSDM